MTEALSRPLAKRVAELPNPAHIPLNPPISEGVIEEAFRALDEGRTHYTDRPGILPLREKITAHLQERYNLKIKSEAVTITCGVAEAEFVALKYLATPGSRVLAVDNDDSILINHLQPTAALVGFQVEAVERYEVTDPQSVSMIYIGLPSRFTPGLLEQAVEHNWWVLWSTRFHSGDIGLAEVPSALPRTVIVGGFDTTMPGWRVGWMAGSDAHNKLRAFKQSMTICTTSISQWAAFGLERE